MKEKCHSLNNLLQGIDYENMSRTRLHAEIFKQRIPPWTLIVTARPTSHFIKQPMSSGSLTYRESKNLEKNAMLKPSAET
jgi:hypothetical protein